MRPKNLSARREYRISSEAAGSLRRELAPKATEGECASRDYVENCHFRGLLPPQAVPLPPGGRQRFALNLVLCARRKKRNIERSGRLPAEGAGAEGD